MVFLFLALLNTNAKIKAKIQKIYGVGLKHKFIIILFERFGDSAARATIRICVLCANK